MQKEQKLAFFYRSRLDYNNFNKWMERKGLSTTLNILKIDLQMKPHLN